MEEFLCEVAVYVYSVVFLSLRIYKMFYIIDGDITSFPFMN